MKLNPGAAAVALLASSIPLRAHADDTRFMDVPVYWNQSQLPKNFGGQSPETIYNFYASNLGPQRQFETSWEYNQRLWKAKNTPVIGNLKISDYFACMIWEGPDFTQVNSYDADKSLVSEDLLPSKNHEEDTVNTYFDVELLSQNNGEYEGENGFGAVFNVTKENLTRIDILFRNQEEFSPLMVTLDQGATNNLRISGNMGRDEAMRSIGDIRVLALFKLIDPAIYTETQNKSATVDSPTEGTIETDTLNARIDEFWLYDVRTGKIINKVKVR